MRLLASTVWMQYSFEPSTGRFRRHLVTARDVNLHPISGIGTVERTREHGRTFFALYLIRGVLTFQAGSTCWDVNDESISFSFEGNAHSWRHRFAVLKNERDVWNCSYQAPVRAFSAAIDGTYDHLDFESDHLLYRVASQTKSSNWKQGIAWTDPEPPN